MAVEGNPPALSATTARYETTVKPVTIATAGWQRIAKGDARRWYVHIVLVNKAGPAVALSPGPAPISLAPAIDFDTEVERKYRDCPSTVQGEWYAFGGVGTIWLVEECLFLG